MKKRILPLLLALLLIGSLTTALAADSEVTGVFDVRALASGYGLTVGGTLSGGVYTNVTSYTLTTPAMKNGDQVTVMLASGTDDTPAKANIKYIDQQTATSSALSFKLLPGMLSDGVYTVYVSSSSMDLTKVAAFQKGVYVPFAIGTTSYASLDAALAAARSGETVKMQSDAEASGFVHIPNGVTVDLNGHTLTAKASVMAPAGSMIDSSNGNGLLKVKQNTAGGYDSVYIQRNNGQTTLYDKTAGGYRFFDVTVYSFLGSDSNEEWARVWCKPVFTNDYAYELLAAGGHGDEMVVNANWGAGTYRFSFKQSLLTKLCTELKTEPRTALWVKFIGLKDANSESADSEAATGITAVPTFGADTGIFKDGDALTLKK